MQSPLIFKNASSISLVDLASAFNAGFEGYFYPPQMTAEILSRRVRMEHIDLQLSFLADVGGTFAGFALFSLRGREAWCGGLGVVPNFRGRGVAKQLMLELFSRARKRGVTKIRLEVLTKNTSAIRLYERVGLKVTRDLLILERTRDAERVARDSNELYDAEPDALLPHFERLHSWRHAWQREFATIVSADKLHGVYVGDKNKPDAYALVVTRPDGLTQVIDLAASTAKHARAIAAGIAERYGAMRVVNEPEESLFIDALKAHGFVEADRQYEMSCEISEIRTEC
jgi:GNAT superfamily N-acetyltransferase